MVIVILKLSLFKRVKNCSEPVFFHKQPTDIFIYLFCADGRTRAQLYGLFTVSRVTLLSGLLQFSFILGQVRSIYISKINFSLSVTRICEQRITIRVWKQKETVIPGVGMAVSQQLVKKSAVALRVVSGSVGRSLAFLVAYCY